MNPIHMLFDDGRTAAGSIVFLGKMLLEHTAAEIRIVPGDFLAFGPGLRLHIAVEYLR